MQRNKKNDRFRNPSTIAIAAGIAIAILIIAFLSSNKEVSVNVSPTSSISDQPNSKVDKKLRAQIDCKIEWIQSAKETHNRGKIILTEEYKDCSKSIPPEDLKFMTESLQKIAAGAETIQTSAGPIDIKKLVEAPIAKVPPQENPKGKLEPSEKFQLKDLKTKEEKIARIRGLQVVHQLRDCETAVLRSALISLLDKKQTTAPGAFPCFVKGGLSEAKQKLAKKFIEDSANQRATSTWHDQEIKLTDDNLIKLIERVDELLPDTFPADPKLKPKK
jgi:hypothetical protein